MSNQLVSPNGSEQEVLIYAIPDEVLEDAAALVKERVGSATLSFCSGLDTCPA